jgi:hypothetical protein
MRSFRLSSLDGKETKHALSRDGCLRFVCGVYCGFIRSGVVTGLPESVLASCMASSVWFAMRSSGASRFPSIIAERLRDPTVNSDRLERIRFSRRLVWMLECTRNFPWPVRHDRWVFDDIERLLFVRH